MSEPVHASKLLEAHEYLFISEVCQVTRKSRGGVYEDFKAGRLTPLKIGGKTVVRSIEIRRYLDNLPIADFAKGHADVAA